MEIIAYIDPGSLPTVGGWLAAILAAVMSFFALVMLAAKRSLAALREHWLVVTVLVGVCILLGSSALTRKDVAEGTPATAPAPANKPSPDSGRLIILGLDGLSPHLLEPLLEAGDLPHFAALKARGCYHRLATTNPPQSPVAWAAFATGVNPARHGIYDFLAREADGYLPKLALTQFSDGKPQRVRQAKAFWEFSTSLGAKLTLIGCPGSFPPDAINGKMLSGMGTPDLIGSQGTYTFYTSDASAARPDSGGQLVQVAKAPRLKLKLPGPQKRGLTGKAKQSEVAFTVHLTGEQGVRIELQGQQAELGVGRWSDWMSVQYKIGLRPMHGILRFYLESLEPELRLFASPVGLDPRQPAYPVSHPDEYAADLAASVGLFSTRGMPFETWGLNSGHLSLAAFTEHADELMAERVAMLEHELTNVDDVFFCYFDYPDIMQHIHWRYIDEAHPLYDATADDQLKGRINDVYRRMDEVVGKVLSKAGENDVVIVLSDHGFTSFRRSLHVNAWLRENGYLVLLDNAAAGTPLFTNVDWQQTQAYALGFGGIYLNLAGREKGGMVRPDARDRLRDELAAKLGDWRDPETQQPVLKTVYKGNDIYTGPLLEQCPDLVIGPDHGYRVSWQTAIGAAPLDLLEDNRKPWSGTHIVDPQLVPGIFFANRPIEKTNPSLYDLCPTILRHMGMDREALQTLALDGDALW